MSRCNGFAIALCSGLLSLAVTACSSDNNPSPFTSPPAASPSPQPSPSVLPSPSPAPLALKILHVNDHHSQVEEPDSNNRLTLRLLNAAGERVATQLNYGGFSRVVQKIDDLSASGEAVLKLHAGDAITGDIYFNLTRGQTDADLMNQVCFDAFVLGNHEFDEGDQGLVTFLDFLADDASCETAVVSANVQAERGVSPLRPTTNEADDYYRPSAVFERDGVRVGVVGITIAGKTKGSSRPDDTTLFENERAAAQREIDALKADGIDHIILLSHAGYQQELELAENLTDVDVVVGGDSHSLLGEGFSTFGLNPVGPYPSVTQNADGDTVCVVQAWQYSYVVGELNVQFTPDGKVASCNGTPHLLLGDTLLRSGAALEGAELAAAVADINASPLLSQVGKSPRAEQVLDFFRPQRQALFAEIVASAPETLCNRRVPGSFDRSRSPIVGCADATDARGGDIQQLVAAAFLQQGRTFGEADLSIQNAGGVRVDIQAGDVSVGNAYQVLPFNNSLVRLTMTGTEIKTALEDAIDNFATNPGSATGAYPYAADLRWTVDITQEKGERLQNLEIKRGDVYELFDLGDTYRVIVNDFIASGQDGYTTLGAITGERREDTFLQYTLAFLAYLESQEGVLNKLPDADYSTQQFIEAVPLD